MNIKLRTLVTAVMGTAAFEAGPHNVLAHPEAGREISGIALVFGVACLSLVTGEVIAAFRAARPRSLQK